MAKQKYWDGSAWQVIGTDANKVSIVDAGNLITATETEGALQEIASDLKTLKQSGTGALKYGTTAGSANAYTLALNPALTTYTEGLCIAVKIHISNTGASTININGLGAKTILDSSGKSLSQEALINSRIYLLVYDGTNFKIQGDGKEGYDTTTSGLYSHAEGEGTIASGISSHAEGADTTASGDYAHSEGYSTSAHGSYSHAEGRNVEAIGAASHVEGSNNRSEGMASHAEGDMTIARGSVSHTEGGWTVAYEDYAHVEGLGCVAVGNPFVQIMGGSSGDDSDHQKLQVQSISNFSVGTRALIRIFTYAHAGHEILETVITEISGNVLTIVSNRTPTSDWMSIAAAGLYSEEPRHAEGHNTTSVGIASHAEGAYTIAEGHRSHAEGQETVARGEGSHAEGSNTTASGNYSHAEGIYTTASGNYSHAEGSNTTANAYLSHAMGRMNKVLSGNANSYVTTADAFVIGNGNGSALSNAFRVTFDGKTYGLSAFNSTGADYAEFFEWVDGNEANEERIGYFVTLDGDKIQKANSTDEYILGVVSVNPSVIGDSHQDVWSNMYLTDEWGRIQYHYVDMPAEMKIVQHKAEYKIVDGEKVLVKEACDEEIEISPARQDYVPILNPEWDPEQEYIPREQRKEWSAIGIMGKLLVRDDGTCEVNGYCKSNDDGVATASTSGYRVMKRVSENIIQILLK